jgi:hypothetical protein
MQPDTYSKMESFVLMRRYDRLVRHTVYLEAADEKLGIEGSVTAAYFVRPSTMCRHAFQST